MPRGPKGEKRPADVIGCAHKVFQIAVGEDKEELPSGRMRSGIAGAKARAESLPPQRRSAIAAVAAKARWEKKK